MKFFKNPFRRDLKKPEPSETGVPTPSPEKKSLRDRLRLPRGASEKFSRLKGKLSRFRPTRNRKVNTILIVTGAGAVVAGVAADLMFLGGLGTVTVISCLYSDFQSERQIRRISAELGKIDRKIEDLRRARLPVEDYAPALSAVRSSIEDFQTASRIRVPPEISDQLEKLKTQVEQLQEKVSPPAPKTPRAP